MSESRDSRPLRYWIVILVATVMVMGCRSEKNELAESVRPVDFLASARRMIQIGDFDSAADTANKALLQNPDSADAKLIACEAEAGRGNHQTAADLAASIDIRSRLGKQAVDVRYQQLLKLGRDAEATDVILEAIELIPDVPQWRHQAWNLLNRAGRREKASQQADHLCRTGQANESELLSLLRRNDAFPFSLHSDDEPSNHFEPGLGMARWYFTQQAYSRGLEELAKESQAGFPTPAAAALYGRLLAETQSYEDLPAWYAKCGEKVREHSDYWAAIGTFFFDHHHFEASARALLESMLRDPTDEFTSHRLAKVFDALGRPDDAEQFRHGGVLLVQMEQTADKLIGSPTDTKARNQLMQQLLPRGRPFEALQWSLSVLPASAVSQRRAIENKRAELSRDSEIIRMAAEASLFGIDPADFSLQPAIDVLGRAAVTKPSNDDREVEQLAVPRLVNIAGQVGLDFQWYQDVEINLESIPIHEVMGGGIAVLDYDLDGWPDVYLAQGSGDPPTEACTRSNVLFRNHDMRFETVTSLARVNDFNYSSGIAAGDVNQDGFPDLYLGALGRNRLLINNGDGTFRDATSRLGEQTDLFTSSLAIADINGDALPDLYEATYVEMEGGFRLPEIGPDGHAIQHSPLQHFAESDRWFENLGDGSFQIREIGEDVALPGTALGLVVTDFDGDGSNEIFVANDGRPNHLLVQAGGNRFLNVADAKGVASGFSGEANACMGIAWGDFNRDGTLDLHVTNFLKESANHYLQTDGGSFTDFASRYGLNTLSVPYIGFGTKAIDIDRNGWLDLIVTNGHIFDMRHSGEEFQMPPQLLINRGNRFEPTPVDDDSGYWDQKYLGRSIATADFDRDGAIDFLVGHLDQPLALLDNQTSFGGQWIQFELVGTTSERDAIGARVVLTTGDKQLVAWVTAGDGYLCSDEAVIDVGLGATGQVDKADVFWPSGRRQTFHSPKTGRRYLVVEGEARLYPRKKTPRPLNRIRAALQLRNRAGNIRRLGVSPGFCERTVASAKAANPKIKLRRNTMYQARRRSFSPASLGRTPAYRHPFFRLLESEFHGCVMNRPRNTRISMFNIVI